jgi:universal stress protein A
MICIERILCPASLPAEPDEALRLAVSLARAYNAKLFLCHCAGAPTLVRLGSPAGNYAQGKHPLADSLASYIGTAESSGFHWKAVFGESGNTVGDEIVRVASERRVDLIVMRSRRSGGDALLGSTAEQVCRTASSPVLVVRPKERAPEGEAELGRVLVSHDFSSASELALSYALSIAQKCRAELHLLHVLPESKYDGQEVKWGQSGFESAYLRVTQRLQDAVPNEVYSRRKVVLVVRWGKPYREVLAYAREQEIDLVCMGALGRDFGVDALFGSNVDRVLRQAPCPVLIARPLRPARYASVDLRIEAVR